MRFLLCLLLPLVFFISSCAREQSYTVKNLLIHPNIATHYSNYKENIGLQVTDARSDARVGVKRFGFESASPILVLDTARPVLKAFQEGLGKVGFMPTAFYETSDLSLDIRILDIDYTQKARVVAGDEMLRISAEVTAYKDGQTLTRHHKIIAQESDLIRPSATYQMKAIDRTISKGLAQLVEKALSDQTLIAFLKG